MVEIKGIKFHTVYLPVINNGAPVVKICGLCGAVVIDLGTHADWHVKGAEQRDT